MARSEQVTELQNPDEVTRLFSIQTESYGFLDIPALGRELQPYRGGTALDIGSGEGSFLFKLAAKHPTIRFLGIEPDTSLLKEAQMSLRRSRLVNVRLAGGAFGSTHKGEQDVILARFACQHNANPEELVATAYAALNSGGLLFCIEPVYDFYDSYLPDRIWRSFRKRTLASYAKWGSHPNLPKALPSWLVKAGFSSVGVSIQFYSAATIGTDRFEAVVLASARMFRLAHPEIWDDRFTTDLRDWIKRTSTDPFITIAHIRAVKPAV